MTVLVSARSLFVEEQVTGSPVAVQVTVRAMDTAMPSTVTVSGPGRTAWVDERVLSSVQSL